MARNDYLNRELERLEAMIFNRRAREGRKVLRIVQANIDKFKRLLETETDPAKRAILIRLLAEQESEKRRLEMTRDAKKAY